ncbi:MAG: Sec-independent protein translocase protein TatB [Dissulfurispiraceae bacterium]|jgi:Tat protein translocase TatB subunit
MFDFGIQELILIFVVALVVFGPKRLPEIAHAMGKGLAEMKKAMSGVKEQINAELHDVKDIKELKDLDPIALKNELFKSEDLFKINETPQTRPQQKVEGPKEGKPEAGEPQSDEKPSQLPDERERKVQG